MLYLVRLLDLIKPFQSIVPEIQLPYEKIIFDEKIVYTVAAAAIYLLLGLPLNGVNDDKIVDPFSWLRPGFGSRAGTCLEFGVFPAAFAAFFWQIVAGKKLLKVDFSTSSDRRLFQTLQKLTSFILAFVFSILLVFSNYFEPLDFFSKTEEGSSAIASLSIVGKSLIVVELTVSNAIVTLLIELLDKGYGFGPGILAYIAVSSATTLATSMFGLTSVVTSRGSESSGALIQLVRNLFSSKSWAYAVYEAFSRNTAANLTQVYIAILAFFATIYLSNCRYEISVKSTKVRGMTTVYPIKLLYCGALPVLFTFSIIYFLNIFGFTLTRIFANSNYIKYISLVGHWSLDAETKRTYNLDNGLLYLISAAPTSANTVISIIRPFTFLFFVVMVSTYFAKAWPFMSGSAARSVAKTLKDQDITLVGRRDVAVAKELGKIISPASRSGALFSSAIVAAAECCGKGKGFVFSTCVGILSGLSIMEDLVAEWQQTGAAANSQFSQFLPTQ